MRARNFTISAIVVSGSAVAACYLVTLIGLEPVRLGLRWAFGPAAAMAGVAGSMLGKVHDLAELKGVSLSAVDRLRSMIRIVQIRLWLGSTPLTRTLQLSLMMGQEECHAAEKAL